MEKKITIFQLGFNMLGFPVTPRALEAFAIEQEGPYQLSPDELLSLLTLVWTDRRVVRLVGGSKFDLKYAIS